jgi:hypothetical protein
MRKSREIKDQEIAILREDFTKAVSAASHLLGNLAFRLVDDKGKAIDPGINRALIEAQLLAFSWLCKPLPSPLRAQSEIFELFRRNDFMDAIQRATGDRARTLKRIRETVLALERAGAKLDVSYDLHRCPRVHSGRYWWLSTKSLIWNSLQESRWVLARAERLLGSREP